jgi:hypothetical protein
MLLHLNILSIDFAEFIASGFRITLAKIRFPFNSTKSFQMGTIISSN